MQSPFPGMDPYLEQPGRWRGIHVTFLTCLMARLNAELPTPYTADIEESVQLVEADELSLREAIPDVNVTRGLSHPAVTEPSGAGHNLATLEPVVLSHPPGEQIKHRWIEIRHAIDRSLISVIELLSPTNKADGRSEYLAKRVALMAQHVHLIEIDLFTGGKRLPMQEPLPPADYLAMVSRAENRPLAHVYSWSMRDRLPRIPIPLKAPDADHWVDLQAVFAQAYESGAYGRKLDYAAPPAIRLRELDANWVTSTARGAAS